MSMDEIQDEVKSLDNESKALIKELYKMAWFMRGALSIEQAYMMCIDDRMIISDIINENLETTKESGLPFF